MPTRSRLYVLCLLPALAWGANTQIATDQPIVNFRLPEFTPEGNRAWLVRGSEARYVSREQIDIKGLNLSIFTGEADGKVQTSILSPAAEVRPLEQVVRGKDTIRVVNDQLDATGADWTYSHKEKKVSINKNVHVVLHTGLNALLQ
ncbi:MAG TPA: hypothetical protein VG734_16050 [Lacunisphaera sp.]|nr:hypothetical protein [Lacunisphaera sp.]